ncbi:hypothetical protein [Magnetovibrio blakemorei]|uniref:Uncharacterized protein n=1 Tax=Magnetovibrio blakemorei TaxID=28181 RepID=A0A1E5QB64_9PROT|nr:hypothetical protein [Magnetovibrio blakemorei]OEJ69272.1 hypothetical protein BEN30_04105 [Magnetovibrio blakemorei]
MSHISIEYIITLPQNEDAIYEGFTVLGVTEGGSENVNVYFEIPENGVMSANLPTVSDEDGHWRAVFHGKFRPGTEVTAYARGHDAALAHITKIL